MTGLLVQIAALVGVTHGFRALGRRLGPRRSGLLIGLPSTTALVLVGCGLERGVVEATAAAEACLAGLVGAAVLPLSYARAVGAGWKAPAAAVAAVGGYVAAVAGLWWLPGLGAAGCAAAAAAGLTAACHLARRTRPGERSGAAADRRPISRGWVFAYRSAVPAGYVLMIRVLRTAAGAGWSGRFITFPGASLAVLVVTHLEAGPETAGRLASVMPAGSFGMLAFLTAFRFGCPWLGLGWGTAGGFAAALAALLAVEAVTARREAPPPPGRSRVVPRHLVRGRAGSFRVDPAPRRRVGRLRGRRRRARFSPWFETLPG